ncbi:winged helix-turn-helix domain-containing protein [Exilibacterium tricleocarpae]|uniref:Winged helix-turn-helix domain-containing protein n=1 Tax=Exilibacterium tricleocarpae TaxID=2591008 RepID=A0A545ST73_9GAMM|nr:crosslink repair DNA glycosylase YcaQ family protein [Exilibacterium tricleocarpae]TQV68164.1 winged helix-turn-helix domain-containing protein [Exilibacterium tricleocarpae]
MIEIKHPKELARLRRLALAAQGLLQTQPYGRGLPGARKAINHIGYVQIDTISVVERAHHHVFHSRVPKFEPAMTNQMLLDGDIFEYWAHAAAFLPSADFRFSLPYKHAIKSGQTHWYRTPDKKLMRELLARIRSDGPIRSRDIETSGAKRAGWWNWKPAKKALEQLYMEGDLMVSDREGFQKTYDLTERVLPSHINSQPPSVEEFAAYIVDQQLRCHGLVSLKGLTYRRRNAELRKAVKALVNERLVQRDLEQVRVSNGEVFVLQTGALERPFPRLNSRMLILSPFDNSVIQRERLKALFHYDYQIECYVPAAKRRYGYFCLPLLYRDEFIGRMDCKAHRKSRQLEIKSLYFEQHSFDEDAVTTAFINAVTQFCHFQQCDTVSVTNVHPKYLTQHLCSALRSLG